MGADRRSPRAPRPRAFEPGGITFENIENLTITLGSGNEQVHGRRHAARHEGRASTRGAGNDIVDVNGISGHTTINLGQDTDTTTSISDEDARAALRAPDGQRRHPAGRRHEPRQRLGGAGHHGRGRQRHPAARHRGDRRHVLPDFANGHTTTEHRLERLRRGSRRRRSTPPTGRRPCDVRKAG